MFGRAVHYLISDEHGSLIPGHVCAGALRYLLTSSFGPAAQDNYRRGESYLLLLPSGRVALDRVALALTGPAIAALSGYNGSGHGSVSCLWPSGLLDGRLLSRTAFSLGNPL